MNSSSSSCSSSSSQCNNNKNSTESSSATSAGGSSGKWFTLLSVTFLCLIPLVMFFFQFGMEIPSESSESSSQNHIDEPGPVINNAFAPTPFPNPPSWTLPPPFIPPPLNNHNDNDDNFRIGLMTIVKREHNYISDWVKYHLAMGFDRIVLLDNEEQSGVHAEILRREGLSCCVTELEVGKKLPKKLRKNRSNLQTRVIMKHLPNRIVSQMKSSQHVAAISDFVDNHMIDDGFTHIAHFDVDEYMQLNKPGLVSVRQLVNMTLTDKFGIDPSCGALSLNWRLFGSNGLTNYAPEPVPLRFTCRGKQTVTFEKFIARVDGITSFWVHFTYLKPGWRACTIRNETLQPYEVLIGSPSFDLVQLNHYLTKTWPETVHSRSRGNSVHDQNPKAMPLTPIAKRFDDSNQNEELDYRARDYFLKHVWKLSDKEIENYSPFPGAKCPFVAPKMVDEVRRNYKTAR